MSKSSILYALFCLAVIGGFVTTIRSGFSPFAQGGQRAFVHTAYGPTHK
ncbi:hypothetical protein [Sphingomonas glacialis]|nr:hypothetical protein [Sphingomonas glacialis]